MNRMNINVTNGDYFTLFRVYFEHSFYTSGYANDIQVIPTREAREIIQSYGLIYKKTTNGFAVIYKETAWKKRKMSELLAGNKIEMSFVMYTSNPFFNNYTNIPFSNEGKIYEFSNTKGAENSGQLRLHPQPSVGADDLMPITTETQRFFLETGIHKNPFGLVKIALDDCKQGYDIIKDGQLKNPEYHISFAARMVYWRYLLPKEQGMVNLSEMLVAERYKKMAFSAVSMIQVRGGKEMYSMQSAQKIMLKESHKEEILFRAKKKKNGGGTLVNIVMDLPLPSYKKLNPISEELVYNDVLISL